MEMVKKLKRLEDVTGYKWGIVPFWYYGDRGWGAADIERFRFYGWACVREDKIEEYLSRKRYLCIASLEEKVRTYPLNRDNEAFEGITPQEAIDFALKILDPDGNASRVTPHYLGVWGAVNRNNQVLYLMQVDKEGRFKRVYARAENDSAIIIWKDWQDGVKDIDLDGFNKFLTEANLRELEQKSGILKPSPPSSIY